MTDPLRVARALVDEVRLLPDEARDAVLQGARLRRDALALATSRSRPDAVAVGAMVERFRRARGLARSADLDAWLAARASHREDFARWIRDEAALQSVGLSAAHLAPRDLVDFARVAEGTDALWSRARAVAAASAGGRTETESAEAYFASLGRSVPTDLEAWAQRVGFESRAEALAAIARHVAATESAVPLRDQTIGLGDRAPDFALAHPAAGLVRSADLAGQPVLLGLVPDAATGVAWRALWEQAESTAVIVSREPGRDGERVAWLHDPDATVATRCGIDPARATCVVLDAGTRVRWRGDDPGEARRIAATLDDAPGARDLAAPVLLVREVFDAAECAALVSWWHEHPREVGAVTANSDGGVRTHPARSIKRRADHVVTDRELDARLRERLARRVHPELVRAFHFIAGDCEAFRLGCYDAADGGCFRAHRDDENPAVSHRRFAFTVHLEDPSAWEGGDLRLPEHHAVLRPPRGAAVVYSASLLHEVTPVTRGRRFVLVGFLSGTFR